MNNLALPGSNFPRDFRNFKNGEIGFVFGTTCQWLAPRIDGVCLSLLSNWKLANIAYNIFKLWNCVPNNVCYILAESNVLRCLEIFALKKRGFLLYKTPGLYPEGGFLFRTGLRCSQRWWAIINRFLMYSFLYLVLVSPSSRCDKNTSM